MPKNGLKYTLLITKIVGQNRFQATKNPSDSNEFKIAIRNFFLIGDSPFLAEAKS